MYGWLGTATIRFGCSCASRWFAWCDFRFASVSRFFCESKVLCVLVFKSVILVC